MTCANLITKIIGLVFKIPLTNMLDNEGMGYFNTAYQIYTWLYMLSTAGVPVALSMMISEYHAKGQIANEKKLLRLTLTFFSLIGLIGSVLMLLFSKNLAAFISADKAFLCILAISPALFFVCISSTIRGYFQGRRNMVPTAVSEIIESSLKLGIGILLGVYALKKGYEIHRVAAYAILGVTVGVATSAVFLALSAFFSGILHGSDCEKIKIPQTEPSGKLLSSFFKIAIPVMLSSSLLSMSSMFDTLIVIRRLQDIGISEAASVALYGNYTSYCVTLFNLPPVLIYPIVSTLIPSLCAARAEKNYEKSALLTEKSLKLSGVIALPCAFGLAAMSFPILNLIFASEANAKMAAPLLTTLAPSVFLIGVMAVTNGMLQSFKLQRYSVISMVAGAAIKGISAYILPAIKVGNRFISIYASPISTFLFYFTITILNFYYLARHANVRISSIKVFARPLICSALCAFSALAVQKLLSYLNFGDKFGVLISISVAAVVYGVALIISGAIRKSDISLIPNGERLLQKLPIIRSIIKD